MTKFYELLDCNGKRISAGDRVVLEKLSEKLLLAGKLHPVVGKVPWE